MTPIAVLEVLVTANTAQANAALAKVQSQMKGTAASGAAMGGRLASVAKGGVAALAVLGAASIKMASDFNQQMTLIETQAGAPRGEINKLKDDVLRLAKAGEMGPMELAKALFRIESAGFRGSRAIEVLANSVDLAEVGQSDLESTTYAVVAAMNSGIKGTKDMSKMVGTLNAAVGQGNMRMDDLIGALSTGILPAGRTFGLSLKDITTAIDVFTRSGTPAQAAATRLRMTLFKMAVPGKSAAEALSKINLTQTSMATAMRGPRGLLGALELLRSHLKESGLTAVEQTQVISEIFGGGRTASGILTLLQNTKQYGQILDATEKQSDQFHKKVQQQNQTSSEKFGNVWSIIQSWLIQVGDTMDGPVADALLAMFVALDKSTFGVEYLKIGVEALVGALVSAGQWVGRAASNFAGFLSALLPVRLAVLALSRVWSILAKPIAMTITIVKAIARVFGTVLVQAVKIAWVGIKTFGSIIGNVIGVVSNLLRGDFAGAWRNIKELVVSVVTGMANIIKANFKGIIAIVKTVARALGTVFTKAWDQIKDVFRSGVNTAIDFLNLLISAINALPFIPDIDKIGGGGGGGGKPVKGGGRAPRSARHATGGKVTTPTAIVGEEAPRHPEYVLATNPAYRRRNLNLWASAGRELGVPGYDIGGVISGAFETAKDAAGFTPPGMVINAIGGGIDLIKAAKNAFQNFPSTDMLPDWLVGMGTFVLDKAKDWILDLARGGGGDNLLSNLGNSVLERIIDARSLQTAQAVADRFGLAVSSGFRSVSHNASVGGVANSLHTHGSPSHPGAVDLAGSMGALRRSLSWTQGHLPLDEDLIDNVSGWNHHMGFFKKGGIVRDFARAGVDTKATRRAMYALYMAGMAESRMKDLGYGDSTSEGVLQLLSSTARGYDINPHNEYAVAKGFLTHGYWGKGGAIKLSDRYKAPMVAHLVQGNATGSSVYAAQADAAQKLMKQSGLVFPDDRAKFAGDGTGKDGKPKEPKIPAKLRARINRLGLDPKRLANIQALTRSANVYEEYASRAEQLEGDVFGHDQLYWLQRQLDVLFKLRNAIIVTMAIVAKKREVALNMLRKKKKGKFVIQDKDARKALQKRVQALGGRGGELNTALEEVQGIGSPRNAMAKLPAEGVLGGRIFDAQMAIRSLGGTPAVTGISASQLRELKFLSDLGIQFTPGSFAGMFASGGKIGAGKWGIAGEAGPEPIFGPATAVAMGAGGDPEFEVHVHLPDALAWMRDQIRTEIVRKDSSDNSRYRARRRLK